MLLNCGPPAAARNAPGDLFEELSERIPAEDSQTIALEVVDADVERIAVELIMAGGRVIWFSRSYSRNVGQRQHAEQLDGRLGQAIGRDNVPHKRGTIGRGGARPRDCRCSNRSPRRGRSDYPYALRLWDS